MVLRLIASLVAAGVAAGTAQAEWQAIRQLDEFDQKHRFIATSSASEPSLAFICEAETGKMKLYYKSNVRASREVRKALPRWPVWAYVIVDDQPVRSYPGKLDESSSKTIVFESYDDGAIGFAKIVSSAQRRVLIAIDAFGGKNFRHEIPVAGSAKPIALVFETCAKYRR